MSRKEKKVHLLQPSNGWTQELWIFVTLSQLWNLKSHSQRILSDDENVAYLQWGDHVIERSDARTSAFAMRMSHGTVQLIIKLFRAFQHNKNYQTTVMHAMNSTGNSTHRNSICRTAFKTWQTHRNIRISHKVSAWYWPLICVIQGVPLAT
jgi:hypothetical protein